MTVRTTGREYKRFYDDKVFWPEGSEIIHDDVLLHVDGHEYPSEADPRQMKDDAVVEIHSGWVMSIPGGIVGVVDEMSLEEYFERWNKRQSTRTLIVDCPRDAFERVVAAIVAAGGSVQGEKES